MPTVKIKMETEAAFGAVAQGANLKFDVQKVARLDLALDQSCLLVWWLLGSPGAKYKISISPASVAHEIKIDTPGWKNPIESAISTQMFDTSGHARFRVVKK